MGFNENNLKYDEAYEEVVARLSESFLTDAQLTERSKELYDTDKGLWQTIKDGLQKVIDAIDKALKKLTPDSELGKIGQQMVKTNQELLDRFVAGVKAASDRAVYTEKATDEGGESTSIRFDDRIENYPYNMQTVIKEYVNSVDDDLLNWVNDVEKGNHTFKREKIADTGEREIDDIMSILGIDVTGFTHTLTTTGIEHIIDRHGKNGKKDFSMKDNHDIARIKYVIENYDNVERLLDQNGDPVYSHAFMGADNTPAPMIRYSKKINGTYYVAEAVPDGRYKRLWIQSAYIQKNTVTQASDEQTPDTTSETDLASPVFDNSIPQNAEKDNTSTQKNQSRDTDYFDAINRGDMDTVRSMVEKAAEKAFADSKVRGKDGKLRKVYHWTDNDFFTFDTGKSGKNQGQTHGDGIYISTSKDEFSYAGKKLMTLFADIKNPFEMKLREGQALYVLHKYAETKHDLEKYDGLYLNHALDALRSPFKVIDYLKEYADDNNIKVSDILKDLGYDGVHDGPEWVAFDSSQLKSADPVTYDDKGNVIPLSERFNAEKQDIRYDSRDDFSGALSGREWNAFNRTVIGDNQYASNKIGKTGVYLRSGNKLIVYNGKKHDPQIKAVYNLGDYEYNIHDGIDNVAELFINRLEETKDESYAETILQEYSAMFGTVFSRYREESGQFVELTSADNPNRGTDRQESAGRGVSGGTQEAGGVKFDERGGDLFTSDEDLSFSTYDDIADVVVRNYVKHSEAIGEVLKNTADIEIAPGKVQNIVSRLLNARFSNMDAKTKKTLAIRLLAELEKAKNVEPEEIVNRMIDAVRGVLDDAKEVNERAVEQYNDLKAAFSGKYYLTDDQLADLKEHGYSLNDFKKAMTGKITIVSKDKAARSINGGFKDASELSLEDIRYDLRKDVNGNTFVDVDPSIYDETDGANVAQVIAKIITDRFHNLITANGQQIRINATTNAEWRRSEDATKLLRKQPSVYDDKMKAIGNADELLTAAQNWIGEQKVHNTDNKIIEYARGNVMYRVGQNGYIADVLVGTKKDGSAVLYDLVDIHEIKIAEAPVSKAGNSRLSSQRTSTTDRVSQNDNDVKFDSRDNRTYTDEEVDEFIRKEREEADKRIKELMDRYKKQRHENDGAEHDRKKKRKQSPPYEISGVHKGSRYTFFRLLIFLIHSPSGVRIALIG